MTSDPTRLLDDPTAAPALRDDLRHATQAELHGLDLAAGLAALQQATAGPAAATGLSPLTKLGLGAALTGGAVALWLGLGGPSPTPPASQGVGPVAIVAGSEPAHVPSAQAKGAGVGLLEPATKPIVTAVPEEVPEPEPSEPEPSEPEPSEAEPQPEPDHGRNARTTRNHHDHDHDHDHDVASDQPAAASSVDDVLREARLVAKARSKLARDPSEALALTAEAEREFPRGQLVEERQALAIRALVALGRTDEARRRAEPFLTTYGRSAHAAAVRRALGPEPRALSPEP